MIDVCVPIYDKMEAKTFASFMTFKMPQKTRANFIMVEEEPDIVKARNKMVDVIRNGTDNLLSLWVDADIVFPSDGLLKLASIMRDAEGIGVVTGLYRGRTFPHEVTVFKKAVGAGGEEVGVGYLPAYKNGMNAPFEIDACGAGFMLVRNQVFNEGCNFTRTDDLSEDFSFCMKVRDSGFKIFACPEVKCWHVTKTLLEV